MLIGVFNLVQYAYICNVICDFYTFTDIKCVDSKNCLICELFFSFVFFIKGVSFGLASICQGLQSETLDTNHINTTQICQIAGSFLCFEQANPTQGCLASEKNKTCLLQTRNIRNISWWGCNGERVMMKGRVTTSKFGQPTNTELT